MAILASQGGLHRSLVAQQRAASDVLEQLARSANVMDVTTVRISLIGLSKASASAWILVRQTAPEPQWRRAFLKAETRVDLSPRQLSAGRVRRRRTRRQSRRSRSERDLADKRWRERRERHGERLAPRIREDWREQCC